MESPGKRTLGSRSQTQRYKESPSRHGVTGRRGSLGEPPPQDRIGFADFGQTIMKKGAVDGLAARLQKADLSAMVKKS